jgi:uncharacterized protein (UPF0212 family)
MKQELPPRPAKPAVDVDTLNRLAGEAQDARETARSKMHAAEVVRDYAIGWAGKQQWIAERIGVLRLATPPVLDVGPIEARIQAALAAQNQANEAWSGAVAASLCPTCGQAVGGNEAAERARVEVGLANDAVQAVDREHASRLAQHASASEQYRRDCAELAELEGQVDPGAVTLAAVAGAALLAAEIAFLTADDTKIMANGNLLRGMAIRREWERATDDWGRECDRIERNNELEVLE